MQISRCLAHDMIASSQDQSLLPPILNASYPSLLLAFLKDLAKHISSCTQGTSLKPDKIKLEVWISDHHSTEQCAVQYR